MTATQQQQPNLRHYDDDLLDAHIADLERQIDATNQLLTDTVRYRALRRYPGISERPVPPYQLRQQLQQLKADLETANRELQRRTI